MSSAKLTSKGQITIPRDVREALGLKTGDRVAFEIRDDGTVVVEPQSVDLLTLAGSVQSPVKGVTLDDMERAIRKGATRRSKGRK
jgi:antitoxin PrlF